MWSNWGEKRGEPHIEFVLVRGSSQMRAVKGTGTFLLKTGSNRALFATAVQRSAAEEVSQLCYRIDLSGVLANLKHFGLKQPPSI